MLRKLKFYGDLANFIGYKELDVELDSIPKAISFLIHNFPNIDKYMSPKFYQIKVGNYEISEEEVTYPIGQEDIHFIPVIAGSGSVGRILGGAALIALTVATGGFGGAAIGTFGLGAGSIGVGTLAVGIGATMILSGVTDLLFPLPEPQKFNNEQDPQLSFSFSGLQNTSRAGTPVPIVYGEIFTGSVVISAAIDTNQVEA